MWTAEELSQRCSTVIDQCEALFTEMLTSDQPFDLWIQADELLTNEEAACSFPQNVSPDADVRQASLAASKRFSNYCIDTMARLDLYQALQRSAKPSDPETLRYFERTLRNFERNGLALEKDQRQLLADKKKQLADLCADALEAMNSDDSFILVNLDDLEGMSDSFISSLEKVDHPYKIIAKYPHNFDQQYKITAKYPHMFPILDQCNIECTRAAVERLLENRAPSNSERAKQIVRLRHEIAQLLGYKNYAEYALEFRMAKTPQRVQQMYDQLLPSIEAKANGERQHLLELAWSTLWDPIEDDEPNLIFPLNPVKQLQSHNIRYLQNLRLKSMQVDNQLVQQYFPLDHVIPATLGLYQELLGLVFTKLDDQVWHPDVEHFNVHDTQGKHWGEFYLDLFPRENKYGHAACFPLQCGLTSGQTAKAAIVCNFSKPPCSLAHSEFVTFFHEFGHVMHTLLGHTKFSSTSGTNVEKDFVELPSIMLENYCWDKRVLQRLSKGPDGPLPDSLIDDMIKARNANSGLFYLRQAYWGIADQQVHTGADDPQKTFTELKPKITGYQCLMDTCSLANFWHFFGGYEASYYGYLWSDIYSADLFQALGDCLDPIQVQRYRKAILEKGGSCDASIYLRDFLGRDPSVEAFIKRLN